jgi:hypothetical protein
MNVSAEDLLPPLTDPQHWSVTTRWENDRFGGTDQFYTNGASISAIRTGESWVDAIANQLPWASGHHSIGYDFGQLMFTPVDKSLTVPDPNDRPYAGVLYIGISLHIDKGDSYRRLQFTTGMVGPASLAEQTQDQVHHWVASDLSQGWDYQIKDELILNLLYEQRWKYRLLGERMGFSLEALPTINFMLGNLLTQAQAGVELRAGYHIPDDYGATLIRTMGHLPPARRSTLIKKQSRIGIFGYAGMHGSLVLHNLTLSGNTWKNSARVDKEWFVPSAETGIGILIDPLSVTFSYVVLGREFKGQLENSVFGAFTVTCQF